MFLGWIFISGRRSSMRDSTSRARASAPSVVDAARSKKRRAARGSGQSGKERGRVSSGGALIGGIVAACRHEQGGTGALAWRLGTCAANAPFRPASLCRYLGTTLRRPPPCISPTSVQFQLAWCLCQNRGGPLHAAGGRERSHPRLDAGIGAKAEAGV